VSKAGIGWQESVDNHTATMVGNEEQQEHGADNEGNDKEGKGGKGNGDSDEGAGQQGLG
jgi:hypothetical protein